MSRHVGKKLGKNDKAKDTKGTLRRLWSYLSRMKMFLYLVILMVFISSAAALLGPFLVGKAIDEYIVTKEATGLIRLVIGLITVYILHSLSIWFQNYWMIGVAQDTVYRLRKDLFHQLHQLSIPFFDKRKHGELMSRVTNDIDNVSATLNSSFIQIISSILTLVGTVSIMLWLSPLLTLITLTIVPLMILGMKWITKRTGRLFKEYQQNIGELNGYIEETISGHSIIKTFSREETAIKDFSEKNQRLRTSAYWADTYSGFIPKLMNVLNNLSFAVIAGVGGIFALNGMITIGVIVIFAEYARQFTRPLNELANQYNTLLSAIAGAERVFQILDEEEEAKDEGDAVEIDSVEGKVDFQHVSFSYEKGERTLEDVSFSIRPGETIALVGPTGAGKTTITNLLSRFYELNEGSIKIDGRDIQTIKRKSLRQQMGFVLQDSFLFQGTIADNIRYGRLDASNEEVRSAAKLANAHTFIEKMPQGYESLLRADGSGISQGQKQLLSIARAILSDPSILILDEATSSIDTITELKIQDALKRLMEGRTSVVVAHRLNTIRQADQILVLDQGRIIERGSHEELLEEKGFYHGLYHSQLRESV
ncbi:ABC transporter ATP-binding protein/permease [Rossellomorea aquimaris]|uniref:ABC transporter ATP-binding protein n=1 Tax=Rossellomorea aquimaris TaxID=189382 RepID=UPI001CD6E5D5|nr:ABC transporter ATP-binding protein [Rossellomorea aquimaris]MCA1059859.1 ABC transporter ATP-binding protein/permease [Rossellomorea aquimaris]